MGIYSQLSFIVWAAETPLNMERRAGHEEWQQREPEACMCDKVIDGDRV